MSRHQRGSIILRSKKFYVRYTVDGKKVAVFLCDEDRDHWARRRRGKLEVSASVQRKRDEQMLRVNDAHGARRPTQKRLTFTEFWSEYFVPSFGPRNLSPRTIKGYKETWTLYLEPSLKDRRLDEFHAPDVSQLLTRLVTEKDLGKNTLAHARALLSSIFAIAMSMGFARANPVAGVKVLADPRQPEKREWYTLEECKAILKTLEPRPDARLAFALAFFMGLRPSEVFGLKWEDVHDGRLTVERANVEGKIGQTKTSKSVAELFIIEPVGSALEAWRVKCESPKTGWMFPSQRTKLRPITNVSFSKHVLRPSIQGAKLPWRGLYACRHSTATIIRDLCKSLAEAQQVLRHAKMATTDEHYALPSTELADRGLKMLEAAYLDAEKSED